MDSSPPYFSLNFRTKFSIWFTFRFKEALFQELWLLEVDFLIFKVFIFNFLPFLIPPIHLSRTCPLLQNLLLTLSLDLFLNPEWFRFFSVAITDLLKCLLFRWSILLSAFFSCIKFIRQDLILFLLDFPLETFDFKGILWFEESGVFSLWFLFLYFFIPFIILFLIVNSSDCIGIFFNLI